MLPLLLLVVAGHGRAVAEGSAMQPPLPEPLTLAHALSLADAGHPDLELQRAALETNRAQRLEVSARSGFSAGLEARLMAVEPSYMSTNNSRNNSSVKLRLSKPLYDGGRSASALQAADHQLSGSRWESLDSRQQRYLDILARYFDVLLADVRALRDEEVMTVAYLRWSKLKDVESLGRVSDIDLLEKESLFNRARHQRQLSRNLQQASRSQLAISLNRPGQLSAELELPQLQVSERQLGEVNELVDQVLVNNPQLRALRDRTQAAESRVDAAIAAGGLEVRGEVELAAYNRTTGSTHPLSAGLVLELPLSDGGAVEAERAKQRAQLHQQRALLARKEMELRQSVVDLWLEISALKVAEEEVAVLGDYRELYLDRSRALYEHELKSDLGDAASKTVDYQLQRREVEFNLALAWARLDALSGHLLSPLVKTPSGEER